MFKSFEPRFLCSKIHSNPNSCISKSYVIFWDFPKYFYHQNPFIQFLILFLIHKSIRIDFLFPPGPCDQPLAHSPPPLLGRHPLPRPSHRTLASGRPSRHPLLSLLCGPHPTFFLLEKQTASFHSPERPRARAPVSHSATVAVVHRGPADRRPVVVHQTRAPGP
jgi:hypothetical protein